MVGLTGKIDERGLLEVQSVIYKLDKLPQEKRDAMYKAEEAPEQQPRKKGLRTKTFFNLETGVYIYEDVERSMTQAEMIRAIYEAVCTTTTE